MTQITLLPVIEKLQAHSRTAGATEAPTLPFETNAVFPFSICYPANGTFAGQSGGWEKDLTTVYLDVHFNRINLPTDVEAVIGYLDDFKPLLIADPTLGGTVSTLQMSDTQPIPWEFGQMKYADQDTIGLRFRITFKQQT